MAKLGMTFDATTVAPAAPMEVLPGGEYLVQMVTSDNLETLAKDGSYLECEYEIIDGPYAGRRLWDKLNLQNPSAQAMEIANRTLSAICHATGQMVTDDSEVFHGIPIIAVVKVVPERTDQKTGKVYAASNKITGYKPANAAPAPAARPAPAAGRPAPVHRPVAQPAQRAAPAAVARPAGGTSPWKRAQQPAA